MFNHHYDRVGETFWQYNEKNECFVVNAQKEIKAGDPVKLFYILRLISVDM